MKQIIETAELFVYMQIVKINAKSNVFTVIFDLKLVTIEWSKCRSLIALIFITKSISKNLLIRVLLFRMHELGISPQERKVFFGQLLGMSDAISFTLGT